MVSARLGPDHLCTTLALAATSFVLNLCAMFQVSWVRRRDWHILTIGGGSYTTDGRVQVIYNDLKRDWVLQIKFVKDTDRGIYECQVGGVIINRRRWRC